MGNNQQQRNQIQVLWDLLITLPQSIIESMQIIPNSTDSHIEVRIGQHSIHAFESSIRVDLIRKFRLSVESSPQFVGKLCSSCRQVYFNSTCYKINAESAIEIVKKQIQLNEEIIKNEPPISR